MVSPSFRHLCAHIELLPTIKWEKDQDESLQRWIKSIANGDISLLSCCNQQGQLVEKKNIESEPSSSFYPSSSSLLRGFEACATSHYWGEKKLKSVSTTVSLFHHKHVKIFNRETKN